MFSNISYSWIYERTIYCSRTLLQYCIIPGMHFYVFLDSLLLLNFINDTIDKEYLSQITTVFYAEMLNSIWCEVIMEPILYFCFQTSLQLVWIKLLFIRYTLLTYSLIAFLWKVLFSYACRWNKLCVELSKL